MTSDVAVIIPALNAAKSIGPLIAGFWLYHERYPHGASAAILPAGLACAVVGSALLARHGRKLGEPIAVEQPAA